MKTTKIIELDETDVRKILSDKFNIEKGDIEIKYHGELSVRITLIEHSNEDDEINICNYEEETSPSCYEEEENVEVEKTEKDIKAELFRMSREQLKRELTLRLAMLSALDRKKLSEIEIVKGVTFDFGRDDIAAIVSEIEDSMYLRKTLYIVKTLGKEIQSDKGTK